jgi:hypothetical protein
MQESDIKLRDGRIVRGEAPLNLEMPFSTLMIRALGVIRLVHPLGSGVLQKAASCCEQLHSKSDSGLELTHGDRHRILSYFVHPMFPPAGSLALSVSF